MNVNTPTCMNTYIHTYIHTNIQSIQGIKVLGSPVSVGRKSTSL
jgi:hypothetical protein